MIRVRSKLGKFRIERRLAEGGFATVFQARDTISGVSVALKIPHAGLVSKELLAAFRREVQLTASLDHPNILPIRDAGVIDGTFYVASPLGLESLQNRLARRLAGRSMLDFADQMLSAVGYAHAKRVMHCDLKPDNFIVFPGNHLRLADFGIARLARRTVPASGSGTVGFLAPEQALGKPSLRSDVFSLGLVLYRMFAGSLPEWPFRWPPPAVDRARRHVPAPVLEVLRRAIEVDSQRRFRDATQMHKAFQLARRARVARPRRKTTSKDSRWKTLRWKECRRLHGRDLELKQTCRRCEGPMSEPMQHCPWCGSERTIRAAVRKPRHRCPRCQRGTKADWRYCPWCYGASIGPDTGRRYADRRYAARCQAKGCEGRDLMPFMRYCPWCRRKVQRTWPIPEARHRCGRCRWGVLPDFWDHCPWCSKAIKR